MTIIERLKVNNYVFGMWPLEECYGPLLGKAMQEKVRELGLTGFFEVWRLDHWDSPILGLIKKDQVYRLRNSFQEEGEK